MHRVYRSVLREHLGIDPGATLDRLVAAILPAIRDCALTGSLPGCPMDLLRFPLRVTRSRRWFGRFSQPASSSLPRRRPQQDPPGVRVGGDAQSRGKSRCAAHRFGGFLNEEDPRRRADQPSSLLSNGAGRDALVLPLAAVPPNPDYSAKYGRSYLFHRFLV